MEKRGSRPCALHFLQRLSQGHPARSGPLRGRGSGTGPNPEFVEVIGAREPWG
jgi:hypothetical protein